jgi:hypothetical protein
MPERDFLIIAPPAADEIPTQGEIIAPPTRRGGEPRYTPKLGQAIADRLAAGETLRQVCREPGMPSERTVRRWAMAADHPFAPIYEAARRVGYHQMADEILEIADDARNDWMDRETRNGGLVQVVDVEAIMRSRLRVDTRKWLLSKALPKVYGNQPGEGDGIDNDPFVLLLKRMDVRGAGGAERQSVSGPPRAAVRTRARRR